MSYAKQVAKNTVVQIFGRAAATIISLATAAYLNDGLGAVLFGRFALVSLFADFMAVFADLGINAYYLRELSRRPDEAEDITAQFFGFRIITALIVLLAGPCIALMIPAYAPLLPLIFLATIPRFLLLLNQMLVSIAQARLLMGRVTFTDVLGRIVTLALVIVAVSLAPADSKILMAIVAFALGNGVNLIASWLVIRPLMRLRIAFRPKDWPVLFRKTLPMGALAVLGVIHFKADGFILGAVRPEVEAGIYANAYKLMEITLTLPGMFVGSLVPLLNQAFLNKDPEHPQFVQKAFDLLLFAVVPSIGTIFVSSAVIMRVITENNFMESAAALRILSFALLPWFLGNLFANVLLASDKQNALTKVEGIAVVVNILLNLLIIPRFSYMGASSTTLFTEVLVVSFTSYLTYRLLKRLPSSGQLWKSLAIFAPPALLISVFFNDQMAWITDSRMHALVGLGFGSVVLFGIYFAASYFLKSLPPVLQEKLSQRRAN